MGSKARLQKVEQVTRTIKRIDLPRVFVCRSGEKTGYLNGKPLPLADWLRIRKAYDTEIIIQREGELPHSLVTMGRYTLSTGVDLSRL